MPSLEELMVPASNSRRDIADLQVKVQRARWRLRAASLGGPEWDAATELLADLEAQLDAARRGKPRSTTRG